MSLKNTKNLLIIAAVVVAVLAGTVLLGNYTNILSASTNTNPQVKSSSCCPAAKGCPVEKAKAECPQKTECGSAAKTCPQDSSKPCSAVKAAKECPVDCAKPCCAKEAKACPADCTKPCCAGCPKSDAAPTGCCPAASTTN